jgi:hypothetical protein
VSGPNAVGRRSALLGAIAASAIASAAGCARTAARPAGADSARAAAPRRAPIPLRIDSRFREDVIVYVVRGPVRQRLGLATAASTTRFVIPTRFTADGAGFALLIRSVGGTTGTRSDQVAPQPGQRVVWTLESDLGRSMLALEEAAP